MEIEISEALKRDDLVFIDLRSDSEHSEASIPDSINIPLFDDSEKSELGRIYRSAGENEARRAALVIAAPKLPLLIDKINSASKPKTPLLYCWRGGLRSLSVYQVMQLAGSPVCRLKKGYKSFRRYVNRELASFEVQNRLLVLHGLTGVGKTLILKRLAEKGVAVIDLEGLARHRGSVFGAIGTGGARSQKDFDALLLAELNRHRQAPAIVIEGEGKKIGPLYLPPRLVEAMEGGLQLLLTADLEARVDRIIDEYITEPLPEETNRAFHEGLHAISNRIGKKKSTWLAQELEQANYRAVVSTLCLDYYDRYYRDSRPEFSHFDYTIDANNIDLAALKIEEFITGLHRKRPAPG